MGRARCLVGLLAIVLAGCGGSQNSIIQGDGPDATVRVTVKADGGRTKSIGYRFGEASVEMETRLVVGGTEDATIAAPYAMGGPPPILRVRGFDEENSLVWTKEVQLAGVPNEPVAIDPNDG